jgi:hypothetical protein
MLSFDEVHHFSEGLVETTNQDQPGVFENGVHP